MDWSVDCQANAGVRAVVARRKIVKFYIIGKTYQAYLVDSLSTETLSLSVFPIVPSAIKPNLTSFRGHDDE